MLGRVQRKIEKNALDKGSWSGGQQLRAYVVLAEDRGSVPCTHGAAPVS